MSKSEMPKAYEAKQVEDALYADWVKNDLFNPDRAQGEPFAIMMPPPNVTGVLHLGHALENSLMDVMARYQRMQGKKVLLLPGTDHAAVATQAKVESLLVKEGIEHPRETLGREKLLEKIRTYAEASKATILSQIKKMGTSCDWSRLAYTFDGDRSRAVNEVFVRMYNDGLIYRGYRVVNWSVKGQSTCSDDELEYVERTSKMYYFKYAKDFPIIIATTRPETKLGDTAVAVNPNDERYQQYIGQEFVVDVGAVAPLTIRVIADDGVDMTLGTGALGVTPAHSAVDFEMYLKQKAAGTPIELIQVIGEDGRMTEKAGSYKGLTVEEAREKFVDTLRAQGLLEREEEIVQNVGTSDRFKDIVEALPKTQWFVDVNKQIPGRGKSLKDLMRDAVAVGHKNDASQKISITPDRFEKIYFHWINNLRDWCISRQIWWGHRIPVWYKNDEVFCGMQAPEGEGWIQDDDTLDTWFSSGMWTFSTLKWPESTTDLQTFHPTAWMQMGYEILFFWMARMIMMSTYALDQIPFYNVYIHGILRDANGKKFSKSADNGIDPLVMIEKYGTDALRVSLLTGITPGNDSRFYDEKVESARNFVNKVWNISRFVLMTTDEANRTEILEPKTVADKWILHRLQEVTEQMHRLFAQYDFSVGLDVIREFVWNDFADWYVEMAKVQQKDAALKPSTDAILLFVLESLLKISHPYMPFVTEEIWKQVSSGFLMTQTWTTISGFENPSAVSECETLKEMIVAIRNMRSEYKVEPSKLVNVVVSTPADRQLFLEQNASTVKTLSRVESFLITTDAAPTEDVATMIVKNMTVTVSLIGLVDKDKEAARTEKETAELTAYIASMTEKLANEEFRSKAPEKIIVQMEEKLAEAKTKLEKLSASYARAS